MSNVTTIQSCEVPGCPICDPTGIKFKIEEVPVLIGDAKKFLKFKNESNKCQHEYKDYEGLIEKYKFCVKCDDKLKE